MQVLVEEAEYARLQQAARRKGMSLAEWVRHALRDAYRREPENAPDKKLAAIRAAARHDYPTGDIDQMLAEVERGYLEG
jgi:hypothetical protein